MVERIQSGRKVVRFQSVAIDGINLHYRFIADAVNTAPVGIDLNEVTFKATLYQNGFKTELVNAKVLPLHLDAITVSQNGFLANNNAVTTAGILAGKVVVSEAVAIAGENQGFSPIRFGGGIVLKGQDYIEVDVTIGGSAWDAGCDAGSYIEIEPNEEQVNQFSVPIIEVHPIPTSENVFSRSLGDNVQTISLINVDKDDKEANRPVANIEFECNKFNYNRSFSKQKAIYEQRVAVLTARSCVEVAKNTDMDDAMLKLDLNSANVTSDYNFIVVRRFETDGELLQSGEARRLKHGRKFAMKMRG